MTNYGFDMQSSDVWPVHNLNVCKDEDIDMPTTSTMTLNEAEAAAMLSDWC